MNAVTLDARLASRGDLRFTPAGVPALQIEAGAERRVACEVAAVALGPVARMLADIVPGAYIRCSGFLARRYRTGVSVALHVNAFELTQNATEGN
jgi:primosomal replication protein N